MNAVTGRHDRRGQVRQSLSRFHLTLRGDGPGLTLVAVGRLVSGDGADWRAWSPATGAIRRRAVAVDLSGVSDIDAAGIGVLVRLAREARCRGRELTVIATSPCVRLVLDIVGLAAALRLPGHGARGSVLSRYAHAAWPPCPEDRVRTFTAV
jgi:anti-anti-sigma factor